MSKLPLIWDPPISTPYQAQEKVTFFYAKNRPYYQFSNFFASLITIEGRDYPTVEHFFQASKFIYSQASLDVLAYAEKIRTCPTPLEAFRLGRKRGLPIHPDWEIIKEVVMRKGVFRKFFTHPSLRDLLTSTTGSLIEDSPRDFYWGGGIVPGRTYRGQNRLGIILEEVRYLLSPSKVPTSPTAPRAHWVIPDFLMASAVPEFDLSPFDLVVTLQTEDEGVSLVPQKEYLRFPIPDQKTLPNGELIYLATLIRLHLLQRKKILIHCQGGKGRTGVIVAILLGLFYGCSGSEALTLVEQQFQLYRADKGRKCPHMPQTRVQKESVLSSLGN